MNTSILFLRRGAVLAVLGIGVVQAQAQDFRVSGIKLEPQNRIRIQFPADTNAYYILYRGTTVTNITQPVSLALGTGPMGDLSDQHSSMATAFYSVRQVSQATPLDIDQDGIDDVYELQHGDFLSAVNSLDAAQDHDGDGKSNLEQYQQETGGTGGGSKTCCSRQVLAYPVPRPEGQTDPVLFSLREAFDRPSSTCPDYDMVVQDMGYGLDYHIRGEILVKNRTGETERWYSESGQAWYGPNIIGDFTLTMQIYDPHHSTVVKEGQVSLSGTINSEGISAASALGESFGSLSVILREYEHIPIEATIEPQYDPALAGEEMIIHLKDIKGDGGQPKEWWRIFVKAEKGKILNGTSYTHRTGEYRWFRVGGGTVDIRYKACEECTEEEITETITVMNTCSMRETPGNEGPPKDVIGTKTFKILCTKYHFDVEIPEFNNGFASLHLEGAVPFHAERSGEQLVLKGQGSVEGPATGSAPEIEISGSIVDDIRIEGHLVPQKQGPARLRFKANEHVTFDVWIKLPDDTKVRFPWPAEDIPWVEEVEIPAQEGYVLNAEQGYQGGFKKFTLHRP